MEHRSDVVVIGSGMAGLSAACLLAKEGKQVTLLEQNWLPGGCSSSYPRKGYIFESGATTLVGLDSHMPLRWLLDELGIDITPVKLDPPMQVHLPGGKTLTRYQDLDKWIEEAERVFGREGQREFWEYCYEISQLVWKTSLQQRAFPPSSFKDLLHAAAHFRPSQLGFALKAFYSTGDLLRKFNLRHNPEFVSFVNEQLLITAQNYVEEVNELFGATALCYTNYGNYYMPGGLLNLVQPMVDYLESHGGRVVLRAPVTEIHPNGKGYWVHTDYRGEQTKYHGEKVLSTIPVNNTLELFEDEKVKTRMKSRLMESPQLNSAFQLGLVFKRTRRFECLHHQIHLDQPLPFTHSHSIFLSLSHPDDHERCGPDEVVASISTHAPDPSSHLIEDKEAVVEAIIGTLEQKGFLKREDIIYQHASTPGSWEKWTKMAFGFVGGYPQYMHIKPWQMIDARLDHRGAYLAGDSTYPGQGIPGATLSGIIAFQKMKLDGI